jgi:hypothetical protein
MAQLQERDMMRCRACGREERASEGYPCEGCGTFICIICHFRGRTRCAECEGGQGGQRPASADGGGPEA